MKDPNEQVLEIGDNSSELLGKLTGRDGRSLEEDMMQTDRGVVESLEWC